ncbi:hypothetical protein [Streptomyces sp. B15]|uniref:hypothetical protein n=1 Tax=Streptomyces sp. B15 TaxID=1537797 RepID=UPI001B3744D3|nr:hypothetical protein [Streptomyces sp. B15]MBQ1122589.1 hypothetical protein [Streptomyces sp. B15]
MSAEHEIRTVAKVLHAVALGSSVVVREPYRLADEMAERLHDAGLIMTPEKAAELAAAPRTIYRAEHDSIVMGLYTNVKAARAHCEAEERRAWAAFEKPSFSWSEDEEDGVFELTVWVGGEECATGYVVTPLEAASEYDEGADE